MFNASQYENGHAYDASGSLRNVSRRSLHIRCGFVLGAPNHSASTEHSKRCGSLARPATRRYRWFRLWLILSSSGYSELGKNRSVPRDAKTPHWGSHRNYDICDSYLLVHRHLSRNSPPSDYWNVLILGVHVCGTVDRIREMGASDWEEGRVRRSVGSESRRL